MTLDFGKLANFRPPGPVAAGFIQDRQSRVKTLRGPVGGGKTVTCVFDGITLAGQVPVCRDGQIHIKDAVVGATYGQLERNLYPSWKFWLPTDESGWTPQAEWQGGGGRSGVHKLRFAVQRGGQQIVVNYEAVFAAIGEMALEQFMRGFEPTCWYLFECDQLPEGIFENALGRLGRWPNAEMRRPDLPPEAYLSYVRADLNAPDVDSWYYRLFEETKPDGWRQYVQPSGLSTDAENLQNLGPNYYRDLEATNRHRPRWVKRFVRNEYGPTDIGEQVYPEYSDALHFSPDVIPADGSRGYYLGFDQGLTQPAGLIAQRAASGQWRILREVVPGRMNARRFAQRFVQEFHELLLSSGVPLPKHGLLPPIEGAWADPAGFAGADREAGESAWAETVGRELGITIQPAPTNQIDPRLTAVKDELTFVLDGGEPALKFSRACVMLRKGAASHYIFSDKPAEDRQYGIPVKNLYANPHDALQYLLLGAKGLYAVTSAGGGRGGRGWPVAGAGKVVKGQSTFLQGW